MTSDSSSGHLIDDLVVSPWVIYVVDAYMT